MAADAVVGNLELLGGLHVEAGDVADALVDLLDRVVVGPLQPGRLRDAVVGGLQLAGLIVLHRCPFEL